MFDGCCAQPCEDATDLKQPVEAEVAADGTDSAERAAVLNAFLLELADSGECCCCSCYAAVLHC